MFEAENKVRYVGKIGTFDSYGFKGGEIGIVSKEKHDTLGWLLVDGTDGFTFRKGMKENDKRWVLVKEEFKKGDSVKILSKSVENFKRYGNINKGDIVYITDIYGDPYSGRNDNYNCFVCTESKDGEGGDFFLPKDLELVPVLKKELEVGDKIIISIPRDKDGWKNDGRKGVVDTILSTQENKYGIKLNDVGTVLFLKEEEVEKI